MIKKYKYLRFFTSSLLAPLLLREGEGDRRSGVEVKKFNTAKSLRKNATIHENILWKFLRAKRFNGLKVRRQHPIGPFIVDFYCPQKKLVIELDGGGHAEKEQTAYDKRRDKYLRKQGLQVLRIWNNELTENIDGVFETISRLCGLR